MPKNRAHRPAQLRIQQPATYADNAGVHPPRQAQQLSASISCFGFVIPPPDQREWAKSSPVMPASKRQRPSVLARIPSLLGPADTAPR
jgi:hypothetical protein